MKHTVNFQFEKRGLIKAEDKQLLLGSMRSVFRAACGGAYSCVAEECRRLGAAGLTVNVIFTDDAGIKEYNREYRNIDRPTDVLSFPALALKDGAGSAEALDIDPETQLLFLGDIVISTERAQAQAEEYGHSLRREFAFLTAHSCLHLLGYDHMTPEEAKTMEQLAETLLAGLGITRGQKDA